MLLFLALLGIGSIVRADGYPDASLDEVTWATIRKLGIDRLQGLDEADLQAEYQWALDMASLCLSNLASIRDEPHPWWAYAIEFQRHAGRTARYRGLGERAGEDYQTAIEYAYKVADLLPSQRVTPEDWEENILQDIADTHLTMGALQAAADLSDRLVEHQTQRIGVSHVTQLHRLARIAERQGRFAEAVSLQQKVVQAEHGLVGRYLERHPELSHVDAGQSWAVVVRDADVRRALLTPERDDYDETTPLREAYYRLARALRLNGQLDEAAHALETVELTPWASIGPYRERQDLYVAREWAWLALDRGKPDEARRLAHECLGDYVMSPGERIELLDLVSRALEELGDLQGALDELERAIEIVENKRANLIEDENKQSLVASYAPLYRRGLELVIQKKGTFYFSAGGEEAADARPSAIQGNAGHAEDGKVECPLFLGESFEWSERVKARAMLDSLNRYGRRMAVAAGRGDTRAMRSLRGLMGKVVSVDELRNAAWWPKDTALLEYTYGVRTPTHGKHGADSSPNPKKKPSPQRSQRPRSGLTQGTISAVSAISAVRSGAPREEKCGTGFQPVHGAQVENLCHTPAGAVYLWVVTAKGASCRQLTVGAAEVERHCAALADALGPLAARDDSWVQPASWLYEHTVAPVRSELGGIERLVIVGDGKLCTIPFGVLVTGRGAAPQRRVPHRLLIEDYTISYAPSATVLDTISRRERPEKWDYALWGFASTRFKDRQASDEKCGTGFLAGRDRLENLSHTPASDYEAILRSARSLSLDDLPHAEDEVRAVERAMKSFGLGPVEVLVNEPDMKTRLLGASKAGALRSTRFLHFATHAVNAPQRPYLSGLVLCPPYPTANGSGQPTAEKVNSKRSGEATGMVAKHRAPPVRRPERLTVGELAGLDLGADLVVLSACRSLGGRSVDGDWLTGLTRAFLVAGSSGVVCTTMDTADRAALRIVPTMYHVLLREQEESGDSVDVPAALRKLKLDCLDTVDSHPSIWAPWIYHGRVPHG